MLKLNLSTAEELIFQNREVQNLLPGHMSHYFEQWRLGKQIPMLRQTGKRAVLDFLDQLDDEHVLILEGHFGEKIVLERLNYRTVENYKMPLSDSHICEELCGQENFPYFSTWRDKEHLYISFWR